MKTREKRDRLLVGLYLITKDQGFNKNYDILTLVEQLTLSSVPGEVRGWAKELESEGLIKAYYLLDGSVSGSITIRGSETAEDLIEQRPDYVGSSIIQQGYEYADPVGMRVAAGPDISSLKDLVVGSNSADPDDRIRALAEIAVFETALLQPVIATDLVERFVNVILKWIAAKFSEGAVSAVVAAIILNLVPFLKT
ncbi:MAG: hypothetical protein V4701_00840 [Pseudomonadota bacterium]